MLAIIHLKAVAAMINVIYPIIVVAKVQNNKGLNMESKSEGWSHALTRNIGDHHG